VSKEHDHEYKEVIYKVQIPQIRHWNYADHLVATTVEERVKIFCIKCGDSKDLTEEIRYEQDR